MLRRGFPRHFNFYAGAALGVVAGAIALTLGLRLALVIGTNTFFIVYLALTFGIVRKLTPSFLRKHAAEEDQPPPVILTVMVIAVGVAAVTLFLVLWDKQARAPFQLTLGVASVVLGWFAIHTMWAMHYAYEYYRRSKADGDASQGRIVGGLGFPGSEEPDGTAFLYFAYVIGMTAQTADTNITTNAMRRLAMVQCVFSFFFNTMLVAAAVNIVVSMPS